MSVPTNAPARDVLHGPESRFHFAARDAPETTRFMFCAATHCSTLGYLFTFTLRNKAISLHGFPVDSEADDWEWKWDRFAAAANFAHGRARNRRQLATGSKNS